MKVSSWTQHVLSTALEKEHRGGESDIRRPESIWTKKPGCNKILGGAALEFRDCLWNGWEER